MRSDNRGHLESPRLISMGYSSGSQPELHRTSLVVKQTKNKRIFKFILLQSY